MSRFFRDLRKYWNYTFYSAKSQLKTEVANSYLNWAWWVIEPFCFMLIYAFIFGLLLGFIAIKTDSLIIGMLLHMIINGSLYIVPRELFKGSVGLDVIILVSFVVMVISYIILLKSISKNKPQN